MTPKQKANMLLDKAMSIETDSEGHHSWGLSKWHAKDFVLITVDEIIEVIKPIMLTGEKLEYWKQVKKEIELL